MTFKEKLATYLRGRKIAYGIVFDAESRAAQSVLRDLGRFCRANKPCFHEDPRVHALLEGRREVFLRILDHANLDHDEFMEKYGKELIE